MYDYAKIVYVVDMSLCLSGPKVNIWYLVNVLLLLHRNTICWSLLSGIPFKLAYSYVKGIYRQYIDCYTFSFFAPSPPLSRTIMTPAPSTECIFRYKTLKPIILMNEVWKSFHDIHSDIRKNKYGNPHTSEIRYRVFMRILLFFLSLR